MVEINKSIRTYINQKKEWRIDDLANTYFNNIIDNSVIPNTEIEYVIDKIFELCQPGVIQPKKDAHSALLLLSKIDLEQILDRRSISNIHIMLNCVICMDTCKNAHHTSCCGQIFCKDCIIRWVENKFNCPICRQYIFIDNISPNIFVNRILNEYK